MSQDLVLFLWVVSPLVGLVVWFSVGCFVCASIDDEEQRLFEWACCAPYGLYWLVVFCWPVLFWLWWRDRRE